MIISGATSSILGLPVQRIPLVPEGVPQVVTSSHPWKVSLIQKKFGRMLSDEEEEQIRVASPDVVCFSEYAFWPAEEKLTKQEFSGKTEATQIWLSRFSSKLEGLVLGTTVIPLEEGGGFGNVCFIYYKGEIIGGYQKINPTTLERERGILPGQIFPFFEWRGRRLAILICNDVLLGTEPLRQEVRFHFGLFEELRSLQLDVIFVPLISPYRPTDTLVTKEGRDQTFQEMARRANAHIVKISGVDKLEGEETCGRSLVINQKGDILTKPSEEDHERILFCML